MCGLDEGSDLDAVPFRSTPNPENRFYRAASPVLDKLRESVAGSRTSVVLLDADGQVLRADCDDQGLANRMRRGRSMPGYVWAEEFTGTNAVGIALEERISAWTAGPDHLLEALRDLACAAAPVVNPFTRKLEGVVDMTALTGDGSPLMLPLAMQAAEAIQHRLVESGTMAEQLLLSRFMASRHAGRVVIALGDQTEMMTPNAVSLVNDADKVLLRQRAENLTTQRPEIVEQLPLSSGAMATVRLERVEHDGQRIGAVIEVRADVPSTPLVTRARQAPVAAALTGRSAAVRLLSARIEELRRTTSTVVISGESGVGKSTLARALGKGSDVVLLDGACGRDGNERAILREAEALAESRAPRCLIVTDIGSLSPYGLHRLGRLAQTAEQNGSRIISTLLEIDPSEGLDVAESPREPGFGVRLHVPPLRERSEDLLDLAPDLLKRHDASVRIAPTLMQALMHYDWPGNVRELEAVLGAMAAAPHGRQLTLADLPPHYQRGGRRLRRIEHGERSAIVQALVEAQGNKTKAAEILEIGRATLYRKLRVYDVGIG